MSFLKTNHSAPLRPINPSDRIIAPMILIGCGMVSYAPFLNALVWLCSMVVHELGHAVAFWLSSRIAIPTFGVTVPFQGEPSLLTFLLLVLLGLWWYRSADRAGYRALAAIPITCAPLIVFTSWILPLKRADEFALLAGQGGELVLGALFILLFFEPMPRFFNWGVNRFLFLIIGGCALISASLKWFKVKIGISQLPMGAFFDFNRMFGDSSESMGDMERLMRDHHWTTQSLITFYLCLTIFTLVVFFAAYFFRVHRESPSNDL